MQNLADGQTLNFDELDENHSLKDDLDISNTKSEEEELEEEETNTKSKKGADGQVNLSKSKVSMIKSLLENIRESNSKILDIMSVLGDADDDRVAITQIDEIHHTPAEDESEAEGKIVEGVFDGENMIGPDGKQYSVPANYASKSKLVEGDILKLTITKTGAFIYKQIGPIDRDRVVGFLEKNSGGQFMIISEDHKYRVLTASVTYYKGQAGDEVIALVPKVGDSQWAAVDNIIRKK